MAGHRTDEKPWTYMGKITGHIYLWPGLDKLIDNFATILSSRRRVNEQFTESFPTPILWYLCPIFSVPPIIELFVGAIATTAVKPLNDSRDCVME